MASRLTGPNRQCNQIIRKFTNYHCLPLQRPYAMALGGGDLNNDDENDEINECRLSMLPELLRFPPRPFLGCSMLPTACAPKPPTASMLPCSGWGIRCQWCGVGPKSSRAHLSPDQTRSR